MLVQITKLQIPGNIVCFLGIVHHHHGDIIWTTGGFNSLGPGDLNEILYKLFWS